MRLVPRARQDQLVQQVHRVFKEKPVQRVQQGLLEMLDLRVLLERKAYKVSREKPVRQEQLVLREKLVKLVLLELLVTQGQPVHRVKLARLVQPDLQAPRVTKATKVFKVKLARLVQRVRKVKLVQLDHRVIKVTPEIKVTLEKPDPQAQPEILVQLDRKARLEK